MYATAKSTVEHSVGLLYGTVAQSLSFQHVMVAVEKHLFGHYPA